MQKPFIAVTMGDPAGIGPEVSLRAAADARVRRCGVPLLFGNASVYRTVGKRLGLPVPDPVISFWKWRRGGAGTTGPMVVECAHMDMAGFVPGRVDAGAGRAAYAAIAAAIQAAMAGQVKAMVTGPIHKEALRLAGVRHPGHTEILVELTGRRSVCMMMASKAITVSLATTHVDYEAVPRLLNRRRLLEVIRLTVEAVGRIRRRKTVRVVVCGLNPHAGEHGLFGDEEDEIILPAIEDARKAGFDVTGPLPPDTAFVAARRKTTDAYVCMYHDQGLIPFKMLSFDTGVNITLGLPIVRTSVDHGTAFDIAWQGKASATSMVEAFLLAVRLAGR